MPYQMFKSLSSKNKGQARRYRSTVNIYCENVQRGTVSNWVKKMLPRAGIYTGKFKAHNTRSAATSNVTSMGINMNALLKVECWRSEQTFGRFYNKPIEPETSVMVNTLLND